MALFFGVSSLRHWDDVLIHFESAYQANLISPSWLLLIDVFFDMACAPFILLGKGVRFAVGLLFFIFLLFQSPEVTGGPHPEWLAFIICLLCFGGGELSLGSKVIQTK